MDCFGGAGGVILPTAPPFRACFPVQCHDGLPVGMSLTCEFSRLYPTPLLLTSREQVSSRRRASLITAFEIVFLHQNRLLPKGGMTLQMLVRASPGGLPPRELVEELLALPPC